MAASSTPALAYFFVIGSSRAAATARRAPALGSPQPALRFVSRRALRRAVDRAYASFARRHPDWPVALFDRHFVARHAEPLILRSRRAAVPVTPADLARAWAGQFGPGAAQAQRRHGAAALLAAHDFLALLHAELSPSQ